MQRSMLKAKIEIREKSIKKKDEKIFNSIIIEWHWRMRSRNFFLPIAVNKKANKKKPTHTLFSRVFFPFSDFLSRSQNPQKQCKALIHCHPHNTHLTHHTPHTHTAMLKCFKHVNKYISLR